MDWQPIETAPKDGTPILACAESYWKNDYLWGFPSVISWREFHPNAKGKACWRDGSGNKIRYKITHWMPVMADPSGNTKR